MSGEAINPILVEVIRGGVLESFHRGSVCIVNESGDIIFSKGNVQQICYPRSAMKLLQVIPLIVKGGIQQFNLTPKEIAVMCGSHNAEAEHLETVRSILTKIGCSEHDLNCGAQYPTYKKDADEMLIQGIKPGPIHNNCSGKHAGMLALCKLMGIDTKNYLHAEHPAQLEIRKACAQFYEYPEAEMTIALDGCSAPIFSIPIYNQALAYKNLVSAKKFGAANEDACNTIINSISTYPHMVAGTKRYCTDMMKITAPMVIGKTGAEGVFCMAFTQEKLGVCIKIDDGKMLPQYNVAQALLETSGLFSEEQLSPIHHYRQQEIKNFSKLITGEIRTVKGLFDGFSVF
jgi:L-asparaginase II